MLDVAKRGKDVRGFVCALEDWIIATLGEFNVKGERRAGRVGVWVVRGDKPLRADGQPPGGQGGGPGHPPEEVGQLSRAVDQCRNPI